MSSGRSGTYVIPWHETACDALPDAPLEAARPGVRWRWSGEATRMDGPQDRLLLSGALGLDRLHARAAARLGTVAASPFDQIDPVLPHGFSVTDGRAAWWLALVRAERGALLVCHDGVPPAGRDLWIVRSDITAPERPMAPPMAPHGIAGPTLLETPDGPRRADMLARGDRVLTLDAGAQPIAWVHQLRLSEARLMMMPHLRPLHAPDDAAQLAPAQLVLVAGRAPRDLFDAADVLAPVSALHDVWTRRTRLTRTRYVQIGLAEHHVLQAGGWGIASTHPEQVDTGALPDRARRAFLRWCPDPDAYGGYARRLLSAPETALLMAA